MSSLDIIGAAKTGDLQAVLNCLNYGISVNERDKDNATPLYWSCCRGYAKLSAELIKRHPDINAKVKWGSTALHASCDRGHIACVTLLIQSGAELNTQNKTGNTALHLSAYRGHTEIVKLLVQSGADVFLRNEKGRCASEEAEVGNHSLTAQFLYKKMKEFENKGRESESTIHSCPEIMINKLFIHDSDSGILQGIRETEHFMSAKSECFTPKSHIIVERSRSCGAIEAQEHDICKSDLFKRTSNNNSVTTDDSREALLALVEKLQLQLVKLNEDIVQRDSKIKELSTSNGEMFKELEKYKTVCRRLSDQKSALEEKFHIHSEFSSTKDYIMEFMSEVTKTPHSTCSFSDEYFKILNDKLKQKLNFPPSDVVLIDTPMKEWFPGTDYVVNGDRPIKSETSCLESLTFLIKHLKSGKFCDLKMKLFNDDQNSSMFGYFPPQQSYRKNLEVDVLAGLKHPNLLKSIHSYCGTTERFRRFLTVIVPQPRGSMNSIEIPKQALFIVTEHYSHTLESFITAQRGVAPAPLYGLSNEFFLGLLYQIISGMLYLRRFGIVHRNIHSGSIYMSERFCPVIGNFELAVRVFDNDNNKVALTDACQISAGNSNAWSPELLLSKTREHQLVAQNVNLLSIYDKSDLYAIGSMFYNILLPTEVDQKFQELKERNPTYTTQDIPELPVQLSRGIKVLLRNLVCSSPSDRLDEQTAKLFVGVLLFSPKNKSFSTIEEVGVYRHSKMLSLLGKDVRILRTPNATFEEIQRVVEPELEADFLTNVMDPSFFHMYNRLCALKCLE